MLLDDNDGDDSTTDIPTRGICTSLMDYFKAIQFRLMLRQRALLQAHYNIVI